MKTQLAQPLAAGLLVVMLSALLWAGPVAAQYELGDTLDDFTLLDLYGTPISLSDYSGQVVLINFFATWCPPCNDEVPMLEAMWNQYAGNGLVVLGVDLLEDPAQVAGWVQEMGLTYPIVLSPDWTLFQQFPQAGGFPYNAIVDRQGVLRYSQYGINMAEITSLVQELLLEDPVPAQGAAFGSIKAIYR